MMIEINKYKLDESDQVYNFVKSVPNLSKETSEDELEKFWDYYNIGFNETHEIFKKYGTTEIDDLNGTDFGLWVLNSGSLLTQVLYNNYDKITPDLMHDLLEFSKSNKTQFSVSLFHEETESQIMFIEGSIHVLYACNDIDNIIIDQIVAIFE